MRTLTKIMNEAGSDKGTVMEGWEAHGYTPFYEQWFEPLRELPLRFLEIGVCDPRMPGASLKGWHEYFPNARIYGYDIVDATRFDNDRITTFMGDQSSTADLARFIGLHGGGFDVIIDDGSHIDEHQQASLAFLYDQLKPGGQYIIEDMQVSPDTVRLMLSMQARIAGRGTGRSVGALARRIRAFLLGTKDEERPYLSSETFSRLVEGTESLDILCENKLARLVRR